SMYRGQLWTIRQFAGYGSAAETNRRYKFLLKQGQAGLSVAFDMPTLMGYDSDDPLSQGEVGHCGVAIDSLEDMETLFHDIQLNQITTSMTINSPAAILYAMYIAVGEKEGLKPAQLGGTLQNDILKEYIAQKEYIFPPEPSMRLVADTIVFAARNIRDRDGARDPRSWMLRFHTQTAGVSLTRQQVENNITRTAYEAMAAVLGGTNSLHTNSMDEVLALPTERAAQIALRTQQVLAHETGVPDTIDPLAGSYFIEQLTDEMERGA